MGMFKKAAGYIVVGFAMFGAAIALAVPANAAVEQDQQFHRLLTRPNQDDPMVIWDFSLVRAQGIGVCQRQDAGLTAMQALYDLDERYGGPYPFELASSISSAANVIYCPWHTSSVTGGVDVSRPVYPRPIYPPLMWSPTPLYPPAVA
ncbi:DUF732 domain-containing protein [Mycobacterium barrassiae]|jgi:hypothetical protein|uniref:hypothetical protein n=1 Tax=Mycobacterium barrassiae TaxID=319709 RepID=UPI00226590C0|nr:hypothetical protein [Mycobacterium barrassiae]MCV7303020.1 DUF732 domain-containing protein [Mycobacterium barrassiae]